LRKTRESQDPEKKRRTRANPQKGRKTKKKPSLSSLEKNKKKENLLGRADGFKHGALSRRGRGSRFVLSRASLHDRREEEKKSRGAYRVKG